MNLDDYFGIHAQAVKLRARRAEVLAANLANAETPNYKARDIDFKEALQRATHETVTLARTQPGHLSGDAGLTGGASLRYRVPLQPSLDGNTVDAEVEKAEFARNTLQYQASVLFLNRRIKGLIGALRGE